MPLSILIARSKGCSGWWAVAGVEEAKAAVMRTARRRAAVARDLEAFTRFAPGLDQSLYKVSS